MRIVNDARRDVPIVAPLLEVSEQGRIPTNLVVPNPEGLARNIADRFARLEIPDESKERDE